MSTTLLFTDVEGSTRLLHELGDGVCRGARGASARAARGVRSARRRRGRHAGRRLLLHLRRAGRGGRGRTRRPGGARRRARARADGTAHRRADAHGGRLGRHRRPSRRARRRGRPRRPGAAHEGEPRPARRRGGARPRRAPRQGLRRARLDLPARRRRVPAAEDDLEHEPPPPRVELRRAGARGRGGAGACSRARASSRSPAPAAPGRRGCRSRPRRELVGEFRNGVFWVLLATIHDPALVLPAIAKTIGARTDIAENIGERELLLVLDNLEQVVGAAPELAALVEACPNLHLLVTSRELLRVRGEVEYEVLPLADPEAVELFATRAQLEPTSAVAELCRRLDNMPLALELAAARTKVAHARADPRPAGRAARPLQGGARRR